MGRSIHHPVGLIHNSPSNTFNGYTLFNTNGGNHATMIDNLGRVVHRWNYDGGIIYSYLLENGNLLARTKPPEDVDIVKGLGGSSSSLIEMDWDSEIVWEYKDPMLHHDYTRLPNGNTGALLFKELDEDISRQVKGGHPREDDPKTILGDVIREIGTGGETVNEWEIYSELDFDEDVICPLEHRREWTHANSLNLMPNGDFLVSFRNISTVGIISRETGEFVWKWGPGNVFHQHHPTVLENGNILIFDNGSHSQGMDRSRVIEVNPVTNEIEWEYTETPALALYSFHISSAERLDNGNTLICEGAFGRIFEVTKNGRVVWEYINPFYAPDLRSGDPTNMVFRAHRYSPEHPSLEGRDLNPDIYKNINRLYGGGEIGDS